MFKVQWLRGVTGRYLERSEPGSVLRYSDGYSHFFENMLYNFERFYMMDRYRLDRIYLCAQNFVFLGWQRFAS
jgi:hypothetical protein